MIELNDVQKQLLKEVDLIANAVKVTLGPGGANAILHYGSTTKITKDGVSVARAIKEINPSPVINIIQSVAEKTGTEAGDGTTSSTVFTQTLIHHIYDHIKSTDNVLLVKRYLDKFKEELVAILKEYSTEVSDIRSVAMISSNGDEAIADLVTEVVNRTGIDGIVSLKESDTANTYVQYTEGLKWDSGLMSQAFITNEAKLECELNNVRVEIYDEKLTSLKPVINILNTCKAHDIPLLLAVRDIEYDVLNTLIYNQINGLIKCCVIKIPGHGNYRNDYIDDLKAVIGNAEVIDKVIVSKQKTLFINHKDNEDTKELRIEQLKHRMTLPEENVPDLQKRIVNISNGFATVYVGGDSSIEIKEKIDRFEDAVCAAKSALEEGIVAGGGNTLKYLAKRILSKHTTTSSSEELLALNAISNACLSIQKQIIQNCAEDYIGTDYNIIYKNGKLVTADPIKEGVIDPTKVIRLIIENGTSVAGTLITTKCLIIKE